jgi:hypothetical protein
MSAVTRMPPMMSAGVIGRGNMSAGDAGRAVPVTSAASRWRAIGSRERDAND